MCILFYSPRLTYIFHAMYLTNSRKLSIHRFAFLPLFEMYRSYASRILISTSYVLIKSERIWNYIIWNVISNNMVLPVSITCYVRFIIISKICESSFHRFSVSELSRLFHDKNFVDTLLHRLKRRTKGYASLRWSIRGI